MGTVVRSTDEMFGALFPVVSPVAALPVFLSLTAEVAEPEETERSGDIAFSPLATPLLAGPGARRADGPRGAQDLGRSAPGLRRRDPPDRALDLGVLRARRSARPAARPRGHRRAQPSLRAARDGDRRRDGRARDRQAPGVRARPHPLHLLVIGVRRSRPNAFGRNFTPGGAWRRLYSARSIIATARSTSSGSNPSAASSSRERSSST